MSRWWRAYDEAVSDPKLQRLSGDLFKAWFNLLCLASKNDGSLPSIDDVAFCLRVSETEAVTVIETLQKRGLFDEVDGHIEPHNWRTRQFRSDTSNDRVKRFRERRRKTTESSGNPSGGNGAVTLQRNGHCNAPETETETETEKKERSSDPRGSDAKASPDCAEADFFRRGRQVLGPKAGGVLAKLLKVKGGNIALARSCLEQSSQKHDPTEYLMRIVNGPTDQPPPVII